MLWFRRSPFEVSPDFSFWHCNGTVIATGHCCLNAIGSGGICFWRNIHSWVCIRVSIRSFLLWKVILFSCFFIRDTVAFNTFWYWKGLHPTDMIDGSFVLRSERITIWLVVLMVLMHGSKMVRMKMKHQNANNYFPRCKKRSNAVILGDNFYHVATTNLKFWVTTKVSKRRVSSELSLSQIMWRSGNAPHPPAILWPGGGWIDNQYIAFARPWLLWNLI